MQEISVYLNSHASRTNSDFWTKEIGKRLFRSQITFRSPESYNELVNNLEEDIKNRIDTIVSVGGDGTVHTLIQKLAGEEIALLVVPGGTANDLANELGTINNIEKVISWVRAKEMKRMDLISINGHYMATNGGIGLGGQVAQKINLIRKKVPLFKKLMKLTGKRIYSFFAATEILDPNMPYYKLKLKSNEFIGTIECPGLLINNQSMLGGSFQVAPFTTNDDGKFNVTAFTHKNRGKLIQCLWNMGMGVDLTEDEDVITFETDYLEVELLNDKNIPFFGDGEILESSKKWEIEILPSSLLVYSQGEGNGLIDVVNEVTLS
ncbi:MAG: NAD(+)/NADH kinase [Halobacteriovoraceae bacterium]|nr:NAD(+)/NADH kinase [Halobacteriovoraceae bacterium]